MPDSRPAILQVAPALNAGGVERTTIEIADALTRDGLRPLVASEGGRMEPQLEAAGGELIRMPLAGKSPHGILANAFRLATIVRSLGVKVIHARSRAPAWSASMAAQMTNVPFVTTYHGSYNASNALKRFYNSVMIRSDAVIANSQWTADRILREYRRKPKRLVVIPRGVDLAVFDPSLVPPERVAAFRSEWGAGPDDVVITLPGRLTRWKGQSVFIDALAMLRREGLLGKVRAVMIGDAQGRTEYERELRNAVAQYDLQDCVTIVGHLAEMPAVYLASDIVVSASTDPEAFGRVAAEASAMGRPIVATDHGGARETVLPTRSGLLTLPGDAAELAGALASLIKAGPESRAAMGAAGRHHVQQHFTVARMCADTLSLYREMMAG